MILTLPKAPTHYSQRDQNEMRRTVERILRDFERRLRALEAAPPAA